MDVQKALDTFNRRKKKKDFYVDEMQTIMQLSKKDGVVDLWELMTNCLAFGYEKGKGDA